MTVTVSMAMKMTYLQESERSIVELVVMRGHKHTRYGLDWSSPI